MRLGMRGPYRLDTATINANVAKASAGNYVLGREDGDTGQFAVEYVGTADLGVNAKLKSWIGKTNAPLFMFSYAFSHEVAFDKECKVYHALSPPDNDAHPPRPDGVNWTCPVCDIFGKSRRFFGWRQWRPGVGGPE